ncbi:hypothetical protein GCM10029964_046370 [Kibdelosporangium lantanae]
MTFAAGSALMPVCSPGTVAASDRFVVSRLATTSELSILVSLLDWETFRSCRAAICRFALSAAACCGAAFAGVTTPRASNTPTDAAMILRFTRMGASTSPLQRYRACPDTRCPLPGIPVR